MEVDITVKGEVPPDARDHAIEKIGELEHYVEGPELQARVLLRQEANPRIDRPARAEGEIDLNGPRVRASVAEFEMIRAVDSLAQNLTRQLRRFVDRRNDARARGTGEGGEWHHGDHSPDRPQFFPRPVEEREIIRRKSFATRATTPREAAEEMELLDHSFYLFVEAETGADAVIYHRDDGRIGLIGPAGIGWDGEHDGIVYEESRTGGPITLDDAVSEMGVLSHRFFYFGDADAGRAKVIYMRYDGHYGLIEPAIEPA